MRRATLGAVLSALCWIGCRPSEEPAESPPSGEPEATAPPQTPSGVPDAGATFPTTPDAGPDAGRPDAGAADAGFAFGTPGPWPIANAIFNEGHGIAETGVVGFSTDEAQNRWAATAQALYLLRPGEAAFRRFTAADGLHLQSNPVAYCDSNFAGGDRACPIYGAAVDPGISEIVGGGPNEVFVGYHGNTDGPGDWSDPHRHTGKLDRVRLRPGGTLEVDRIDLLANLHGAQWWHDRTVHRLVFDHFVHKHDMYVGLNHGVAMLRPDRYRRPNPGEWFDSVNVEYMADHLHARVCFHAPCDPQSSGNQRMGGWRGLAIAPDGNLWTAGKWTAAKIRWDPSLVNWISRGGSASFEAAFGDPYPLPPNADGYINEPVFRPPLEGDPVHLTAVSVGADGRVWFASGPDGSDGFAYGVASWDGRKFTVYDPIGQLGMSEASVRDLVALPDGRIVLSGHRTGLTLWDPLTGSHQPLRAPSYLADDRVRRLELDRMVNPPALHVSTERGAAVIRVLPPR
ncbi:MAG: WD40 repeat domain-containing protein [Myxococcales bacterium]|nr:WD40 repeat domain-containing protein [Myxococcales bacterium]